MHIEAENPFGLVKFENGKKTSFWGWSHPYKLQLFYFSTFNNKIKTINKQKHWKQHTWIRTPWPITLTSEDTESTVTDFFWFWYSLWAAEFLTCSWKGKTDPFSCITWPCWTPTGLRFGFESRAWSRASWDRELVTKWSALLLIIRFIKGWEKLWLSWGWDWA